MINSAKYLYLSTPPKDCKKTSLSVEVYTALLITMVFYDYHVASMVPPLSTYSEQMDNFTSYVTVENIREECLSTIIIMDCMFT